MLLHPQDWPLARAAENGAGRARPRLRAHVTAETHRLRARACNRRPRRRRGGDRGAARPARRAGERAGARSASPPPARERIRSRVWQQTSGLIRRALPGGLRIHARAGAARADLRAPRPHRRSGPGGRRCSSRTGSAGTCPCSWRCPQTRPSGKAATPGLASARTPLFQAFPRVGIPRAFASYADYVDAVDLLIRCDAFPEPTFLWWDVRLQPRFGTVEVRIMDSQWRSRTQLRSWRSFRRPPPARGDRAVHRARAPAGSARRSWTRTASSRRATGCPRS